MNAFLLEYVPFVRLAYECQVCDRPVPHRNKTQEQIESELEEKWTFHTFGLHGLPVEVLTCRACSGLRPDTILSACLARISTGRDRNYH